MTPVILVEFPVATAASVTRVVAIPNLADFPMSSVSLVTCFDGLRDGVRNVECIPVALVAFVSGSTGLGEFSVTFVTLVVFPAASVTSVTLVVPLHDDHPELGCISRSLCGPQ